MVLDILLLVVLSTLAVSIVLGKPINIGINITHHYPEHAAQQQEQPEQLTDAEAKEMQMVGLAEAIQNFIDGRGLDE